MLKKEKKKKEVAEKNKEQTRRKSKNKIKKTEKEMWSRLKDLGYKKNLKECQKQYLRC